jgi:hypothetical protein
LEQWWVILRLEKLIPSKYDAVMRQRLVDQLYEAWMLEQVKRGVNSLQSAQFVQSDLGAVFSATSSSDLPTDDRSSDPEPDSPNIVSALFSRFRGKS